MSKSLISFCAALFLSGSSIVSCALAQAPEDPSARIDRLEEHMRELVGQVEELNHQVQVLQTQLSATNTKKTGALEAAPTNANPVVSRSLSVAPPPSATSTLNVASASAGGIEEIQSEPLALGAVSAASDENGNSRATVMGGTGEQKQLDPINLTNGEVPLGTLGTAAAKPQDGGFQGKVLVPVGGGAEVPGLQDQASQDSLSGGVETASLDPDSAEKLYERSNESLLRRQFDQAAFGFQQFLDKYPSHGLAGNAQYWLGETYYAQGDFNLAAQNFLKAYKQYPKGRRAPDSLLKLGISLNKLGQQEQACASFATIPAEYPKAVEAKKRAQMEMKRDGC